MFPLSLLDQSFIAEATKSSIEFYGVRFLRFGYDNDLRGKCYCVLHYLLNKTLRVQYLSDFIISL